MKPLSEHPALYEQARKVSHDMGFDWTDPRTGKTYPAPRGRRAREKQVRRTFLCREKGKGRFKDKAFTVEATSLEDAKSKAAVWNATVVREVNPQKSERERL